MHGDVHVCAHGRGGGQKNGDQHSEVMRRGWLWRLDGEGERKGRRLMFTSDGGGGGGRWGRGVGGWG